MSDTAWISLTVIVVALALVGIVLLLRNKRDALLTVTTNWGAFTFSPRDAKRMIRELYGALKDDEMRALSAFNTLQGKPPHAELDRLDDNALDEIVGLKLVQDPKSDDQNYKRENLRLAYCGWQVLESYTKKKPLADPWRWPEF